MSTTPRFPELPEPTSFCIPGRFVNGSIDAFAADQMHAYGLAVWKAAIQHAAETVPTNWCDELLTGKQGMGQPPYHAPDIERLLRNLRAAILALPLPEQGSPQ